ncbi:hypothetical protein FSP39_005904 [Pinctada imbricata]|uniref:Uncharacterized protein n=1 Tax=Pinctada imbricata TaxID=66713 RepID=A0AA88XRV6_PINIB|nr:hypothetical protein FSP39_005904 [Pinctada imbricata]
MKDISEITVAISLSLVLVAVQLTPSVVPHPMYDTDIAQPRDLDSDLEDQEMSNSQSLRQEDLRKLILKKMRFRDLDEEQEIPAYTLKSAGMKRADDFSLAHKVAELLHGLKVRQVKSPKVRMPSLRFG